MLSISVHLAHPISPPPHTHTLQLVGTLRVPFVHFFVLNFARVHVYVVVTFP